MTNPKVITWCQMVILILIIAFHNSSMYFQNILEIILPFPCWPAGFGYYRFDKLLVHKWELQICITRPLEYFKLFHNVLIVLLLVAMFIVYWSTWNIHRVQHSFKTTWFWPWLVIKFLSHSLMLITFAHIFFSIIFRWIFNEL